MATRKKPPATPSELQAAPAPDVQKAARSQAKRQRAGQRMAFLAHRAGLVDPADLQSALRARAAPARPAARGARAAPDTTKDHLWLPIGPTVVFGGQAGGKPRVAGRIRDLWMSDDGERGYAAAANGGVWYTSDRGESWRPLGGWNTIASVAKFTLASSALACGCLYVRFGADETLDEVLVGTGELAATSMGTPGDQHGGVGVLRAVGPADPAIPVHDSRWDREGTNLSGMGIYRIVVDPMQAAPATTFVAATSGGLWTRTGGPAPLWTQVPDVLVGGPGKPTLRCTDVAWVKLPGAGNHRLYVAAMNETAADPALYVSSNGVAGPFTPIALPGLAMIDGNGNHLPSRISLAPAPSDPTIVYVLGTGDVVWRLDAGVAKPVQRMPSRLLGGQDAYNQAIAVHPTRPERLILGGAWVFADGEYSASLYLANVTLVAGNYRFGFDPANNANPGLDDSYIGHGVHADVHAARFVRKNGKTQIWVGCDGGVFRSLQGDGDNKADVKHSFVARNQGLAVLEAGYVTTHPLCEGHALIGAQDNGTFQRVGVNLWERTPFSVGDGGGVAYQPIAPYHPMGEGYQANWRSSFGGATPPILRTPGTVPQNTEFGEAGFYSGADAIATTAAPVEARFAMGTTRVWLTRNWGQSWVTLPSLRDPLLLPIGQNLDTDACVLTGGVRDTVRGAVVANRWGSESRLYTLCEREVLLHELAVDATAASGLRVTRQVLTVGAPRMKEDPQAAVTVTSPGQRLPELGAWNDIAVHQVGRGTFGSFYVATTGDPTVTAMDTLWWFDGTDRWHATGLRNDPVDAAKSVTAPVYAVAVDPTEPRNVVYVGTAVGVWRGEFDDAAPRKWKWEPMSNGLPEAAVQDLSVWVNPREPHQRTLRAAIQARGVWEVDLSEPAVGARTMMRVHAWDTRRETPVDLTDPRAPSGLGPVPELSWHASPDVRIRPRRGSRPPEFVADGTPQKGLQPDPYLIWVLQTALHADDPLVLSTGKRTPQFEARLKAINGGSSTVLKAFWNARVGTKVASPKAYADPWNSATPTEADLHELIVDRDPGAKPVAQLLSRCHARVHVQVHHRHTTAIAGSAVKVTLLRREITAETAATLSLLDCAWATPVKTLLQNGGALPVLADGWTFADEAPANAVRSPADPLDARQSRTVTFDVDFSADTHKGKRYLLLAVLDSAADAVPLATDRKLEQLVRRFRCVAARSVEID